MFSTKEPNKVLESRLDVLAGKVTREESKQTDLLRKTYTETDRNSLIQAFIPRIISIEKIIEQALTIARGDDLVASDGSALYLQANTLCVHGDNASSVAAVQRIREALNQQSAP